MERDRTVLPVPLDRADDCPVCHGDGTIPVAGYSINPGSGVLVRDPQETHDEGCPECGGTGVTDD